MPHPFITLLVVCFVIYVCNEAVQYRKRVHQRQAQINREIEVTLREMASRPMRISEWRSSDVERSIHVQRTFTRRP